MLSRLDHSPHESVNHLDRNYQRIGFPYLLYIEFYCYCLTPPYWLLSQAIFLSKIEFLHFNVGPSERFGAGGYGNMYGEHAGKILAAG